MNFANEIFRTSPAAPIVAMFADGASVEYTMNIWGLLVSDPSVACIVDGETGEILFDR